MKEEDSALGSGVAHGQLPAALGAGNTASVQGLHRGARGTHIRQAQSEDRQAPLDTHAVTWSDAAARLGIDVSDLWRNDQRRVMEAEQAATAGRADAPEPA